MVYRRDNMITNMKQHFPITSITTKQKILLIVYYTYHAYEWYMLYYVYAVADKALGPGC